MLAIAGILVASALAVTLTNVAFADNQRKSSDTDARGGNGGIGGAGGAGGVGGNGGANLVKDTLRLAILIRKLMAATLMAATAEMQMAGTLATANATLVIRLK